MYRPKTLQDFIGQQQVCAQLSISISAAQTRENALGHILFHGPPGLGKTTLAGIIANMMSTKIHIIEGGLLQKPSDLAGILMSLSNNDVVFIDEIHSLPIIVEEYLYHAMEDFVLDILTGHGDTSKALRIPLPQFTLVGATTHIAKIHKPLRDRFVFLHKLDVYNVDELKLITNIHAKALGMECSDEALLLIADHARGTPRAITRFVRWLRDFVDYHKVKGELTNKDILQALQYMGIDLHGLDNVDRKILTIISTQFNNGPVGIEALSLALGEPITTITNIYEPFLVSKGLLKKTKQGRVLSDHGKAYVKKNLA